MTHPADALPMPSSVDMLLFSNQSMPQSVRGYTAAMMFEARRQAWDAAVIATVDDARVVIAATPISDAAAIGMLNSPKHTL